jgi:hypothetical protein
MAGAAAIAQSSATDGTASCSEFMVPKALVNGKLVGQEDCRIHEKAFSHADRKYRRLDTAVSGTVDGYIVKDGMMQEYFTDGPEFLFVQFGQRGWIRGTARYEGAAGVGMSVFYPEGRWNGKLWIHVTGGGFCAWGGRGRTDLERVPGDALEDVSAYDVLMLEKGYAVARTRATVSGSDRWGLIAATDQDPRRCSGVRLEDGTTLIDANFTDHAGLHLGLTRLVHNLLTHRLGRKPSRTYWYGKSSGARVGRLVNYKPGLNVGAGNAPLIDGFLADDSATGLWLPVLFDENGQDVLFAGAEDKDRFVRQIDVTHGSYVNWINNPLPEWISGVYNVNKFNNARILEAKGLGDKHRHYEVKSVSHSSSGDSFRNRQPQMLAWKREGTVDVERLDLSPVMDAMIDRLDAWVEKGQTPPASRSDLDYVGIERSALAPGHPTGVSKARWLESADSNKLAGSSSGAVALPEVACPLGVYFPYPPNVGVRGAGTTAFAAFDGQKVEPLDGRGVLVDMNQNGRRDRRETVTEAWRRLRLLKPAETFERPRYVECVKGTAARLQSDGLISESAASDYARQASTVELPTQTSAQTQ